MSNNFREGRIRQSGNPKLRRYYRALRRQLGPRADRDHQARVTEDGGSRFWMNLIGMKTRDQKQTTDKDSSVFPAT
jgi:hypothetical protein